jgi:hypothetical protein
VPPARGLTVSSGTTPESFDVEVVGILDNAIAPGIPLIVVEADSPAIDRVGGIWAGMSGSPVYVDGKLLGAVAYGFSWSPSKLAGVTPAEAMLRVPGRPTLPPPIGPASVDVPPEVEALARAEGIAPAQAGTMSPLEIPVQVSGPAGPKLDRVIERFERDHPGVRVVRGTGANGSVPAAEAGPIVPGGNLAVSLSYGDVTFAGVGTATTVCDGVVTAFGHPMLYAGPTRLGMHGARAVRIVDDAVFGPYKLANIGPLVGTIDQDRLAAVAGRVGPLPPTAPITTRITNRDEGGTTSGRTDAIHLDWVGELVLVHGWTNYDLLVFDNLYVSGTSEASWSIEGYRADGSPWRLERSNRHADRWDLSTASLIEPAIFAQLLQHNPYEEVRITGVDYEATAGTPYRALEVGRDIKIAGPDGELRDADDSLALVPGSTIEVHVPLSLVVGRTRVATRTEVVELEVPADAFGGGEIAVRGGGFLEDPWECLWEPEACAGGPVESLDELLEQLAEQPTSDELTVALWLWEEGFDGDEPIESDDEPGDGRGQPASLARVQLDEVVSGSAWLEVFVADTGECPVMPELFFLDVFPESVHGLAIGCMAALGVTRGVSEDPPLFAPDRQVRRDQAASFVARTLELGPNPLPPATGARFTDLTGNVHADAVERLAAAGIVRGRTPTTFDPATPITRAQAATLLVEALRWSTGDPLEPEDGPYFPDVSGVHAANIDVAYELGLVQGRADGTFQPGARIRRDQMASVLLRFHRLDAPW